MNPEQPEEIRAELTQHGLEIETPQPSPKQKKSHRNRFNVMRLEKRVTATFSIMAKVFVIALISVAVIFVARELSDDGYVIQQINVPTAFEEVGYTGPVVGQLISIKLNDIIRRTRTK